MQTSHHIVSQVSSSLPFSYKRQAVCTLSATSLSCSKKTSKGVHGGMMKLQVQLLVQRQYVALPYALHVAFMDRCATVLRARCRVLGLVFAPPHVCLQTTQPRRQRVCAQTRRNHKHEIIFNWLVAAQGQSVAETRVTHSQTALGRYSQSQWWKCKATPSRSLSSSNSYRWVSYASRESMDS
jgi:hypothetical protein